MRQHQELAFRVAYTILGSAADAEDAAQEGFVRAYHALGRFRAGAPFRPWLVTIVANAARNRRTAAARHPTLELTDVVERPADERTMSPETLALSEEQRRELLAAVNELRADDRRVIACRYFLDLSEAETADALGCARGTVKSRLSGHWAGCGCSWRQAVISPRGGAMAEARPPLAAMTDAELEQALRGLGQRLAYPSTPDLTAGVRTRLEAKAPEPVPFISRRRVLWLAAAALLVAIASTLALLPGVRTAIADRLGLRGVGIQWVEEVPAPPPSPVGARLTLGRLVTLDEARAAVDFPVHVPALTGIR